MAKPNWIADSRIFRLLAETWGCGDWIEKWRTPEDAFEVLKQLSQDQPFDITGIGDYQAVDSKGGVQWPAPKSPIVELENERRLFEDGKFFTPDGRARFIYEAPGINPQCVSNEFPFILLTGRGSSVQWHTGTRSEKSSILKRMSPKRLVVEINNEDAQELEVSSGNTVEISSEHATISAEAFVTATVQKGQVFLPMHFKETNELISQIVDPYSRQPNYKHTPVSLKKSETRQQITRG